MRDELLNGELFHTRLAAARDPNDVLAELSEERLGHDGHPSSGAPRHHGSDVTYLCSSPNALPRHMESG